MNPVRPDTALQNPLAGVEPDTVGAVPTSASLHADELLPDASLTGEAAPPVATAGTRPYQDLIPALLDALAKADPAAHSQFMLLPFGPIPAYAMDDQNSLWWTSDEAKVRVVQLLEALYDADPNCYPHPASPENPVPQTLLERLGELEAFQKEWEDRFGSLVTKNPPGSLAAIKEVANLLVGTPDAPSHLEDKDYILPEGQRSVWISVDDLSVYIGRHQDRNGVKVSLFPLGAEWEEPMAFANAYNDEARALRDELDPIELDVARSEIAANPEKDDPGYDLVKKLRDKSLSGEDLRVFLADEQIRLGQLGQKLGFEVLLVAMKDSRPELVNAAMFTAEMQYEGSGDRFEGRFSEAVKAVFLDACGVMRNRREWEPAARTAAAIYRRQAGVYPDPETPQERQVINSVQEHMGF